MAINIQGKLNSVAADGILAEAKQVGGGFISVSDTTVRDNLGNGIKNSGAVVFVASETKFYQWENNAWVELPIGSGGAVNSVNGKTGTVIINADDISDKRTTNKFVSQSDIERWNNSSSVEYTTDEDINSLF